ncbi:MAG: radical SAM protein [Acidobacteriia bacterium]|nr:radical SAM protein [Terriglobia bacterium]
MTQYVRSRSDFEAAYVGLWRSGELRKRAETALAQLAECRLCPRQCAIDRRTQPGTVCRTARHAVVSSHFAHSGEEDCLRGTRGSGTIFFTHCNLRCVFCQNYETSHLGDGRPVLAEELASMMLELQAQGCHNINLVTPSHVVAQFLEALVIAVESGLRLPIVFNTSGYDRVETLRLLDGVVDIYMPDFKWWSDQAAERYADAPDYPEVARAAIREMHRQVGPLVMDDEGVALRGLLLRHLVMPEGVAGSPEVLKWIARELGPDTFVNLMAQYCPAGQVTPERFGEIARCIRAGEFVQAQAEARAAGLWRLDQRRPARGLF